MKIFISSRIKELEPEREIAYETLKSMGFEVVMWERLPGSYRHPKEVYLTKVDECQMFILILWKEYSPSVRDEYNRAERRNIPILVFVKNLNDGEKREEELENFIKKIKHSKKGFRKLKDLEKYIREAVMTTLFDRFKKPFLSHTRKDLYELGEEIATSAQKRLILLARSLILVVGPRPYTSNNPLPYEKSHYEALSKIVKKATNGDICFLAGYLIEPTKKEINDNPSIKNQVKKNLKLLTEYQNNKNGKFSLLTPPPNWNPPFTFIIGDNRFAIWFKDPLDPETYACISSEDETIANSLIHIFEKHCKKKSLGELLKELGIDDD